VPSSSRNALPITAAALIALAGCAAAPERADSSNTPATVRQSDAAPQNAAAFAMLPGTPAIDRLRRGADRESGRAPRTARELPESIFGAGPARSLTEDELELASASLEDARAAVAGELPEAPATVPPEPEAEAQALRQYTEGRASLTTGDTETAITSFQAAARLDPGSTQIWLALGDAHSERGGRAAASNAYRRAVELGSRDPRALLTLGAAASRTRQPRLAASYYSAVLEGERSSDPVVPLAARAGLAEALIEVGYLSAGNTLLAETLEELGNSSVPALARATRFRPLLSSLVRRAAGQWREIGDRAALLGDAQLAVEAYDRALEAGSNDEFEIVLRKVEALVRQARYDRAALTLLERIWISGGLVDDRSGALISYLAGGDDPLTPDLGDALLEIASELPGSPGPTVRDALIRAASEAVSDRRAAEALGDRLARSASDIDLVAEYFDRAAGDVRGWTRAAVELAEQTPADARAIARALRRTGAPFVELRDALDDRGGPAADLLLAGLHEELQLSGIAQQHAEDAAEATDISTELGQAARSAAGELAGLLGDYDRARAIADELEAAAQQNPTTVAVRAASAVLLGLGEPGRALALLDALPEPTDALDRRERLTARADLTLALGEPREAAQILEQAIAVDAKHEPIYQSLIDLYGPEGPLADEAELARVVQTLREAVPSSRTLRWLAANELFRRGLVDSAEPELKSVADQSPLISEPLMLLVEIWRRTGELPEGEAWLRERLEQRPASPELSLALAQLLMRSERPEEAELFLDEQIGLAPAADLRRARETILRDVLGEADLASALAEERFADQGPRLDVVFERARLESASGDLAAAADALASRPLFQGEQANTDTQRNMLAILEAASQQVIRAARESDGSITRIGVAFGRMCDIAQDIGGAWDTQLHQIRIGALLASPDATADRFLRAAEFASQQQPAIRVQTYQRLAQQLLASERGAIGVEVMQGALEANPDGTIAGFLISLVGAAGNIEQMRTAVETAAEAGLYEDTIAALTNGRPAREGLPENERRAELAYIAGNSAAGFGREELSEAGYRLALEYNPRHAWANNNLGYMLTERDEQLEEAESMIEIALEGLPNTSNVIDSLGWVRYKLGQLEDETNAEGEVVRRGAISLLRQAAELTLPADDSGTTGDQLGDALWAAGREDEALRSWQAAQIRAVDFIRSLERTGNDNGPLYQDVSDRLGRIQAKIVAAEGGQEPEIAEIPGRDG